VLEINHNVIVVKIKLNVQEIINVYQKIYNIYVNQLITKSVLIHNILIYVQMDNVECQKKIVQHNLYVHQDTIYAQI